MAKPPTLSSPGVAGSDWNPLTLALLASVWVATLPNWPLWRALLALPETRSLRGTEFVIGFALMIASSMAALLALLAWRATIKPAIIVVLIVAALGAHFMGTYGVVIDTTMMVNIEQTDAREVRDLLSLPLMGSLLLLAGLPALLLWRAPVRSLGVVPQAARNALGLIAALALLATLVFALFADLSATMRNHRSMRYLINPMNSLYALVDLSVQSRAKPTGPPLGVGVDARIAPRAAGTRPPLLVLAIGETARADHFSLNGYARPTNPELATLDVLSFRSVMSCGTNTAASLPCMFSPLGKTAFESRERDHENLLDLVQHVGMAVLWVDNQAGCKGLCERVAHVYAREPVPGGTPLPTAMCDGDECLDDALLHDLDARIDALPAAAREQGILLVLHQMGSHGPEYYKRSPPQRKPFTPECRTNVLQECDHASIINAYDNSIAYTDHVLAQTVHWLMQRQSSYDTSMLYLSDHGESLGEDNLYLHGLPYSVAPAEQKHVPMVLWMSEQTRNDEHLRWTCLAGLVDQSLTHDSLFHSSLGMLGIQASEYKKSLDPLAGCRTP